MNFQFYLEKLNDSEKFKEFMLENPEAYMCSGFFVIDNEKANHQQHLDFYVPSSKKVFSFKLENGVEKVPIDMFNDSVPKKLLFGYDFDLDEVEKMILDKMGEQNIKKKIQKILISLQRTEAKDMLTATVFISGLGMLKINLEPISKKITDFDKKSFFDMLKIIKKK